MARVRWLSEREDRAWRTLQQMHMQLTGQLGRQLAAESTLSYQDYEVLVALTDQPDSRIRVVELGRLLGWEKSRMSHHLARMVKRGLVEKTPCRTDRRGAFVSITARGHREVEAAAPGHVTAVRHLFIDQLTPAQLDCIAEAAETVLQAVITTNDGEP